MKTLGSAFRVAALALAAALVLALLAACTQSAIPNAADGGPIATQASGSFSGGSLDFGSVKGTLIIVGLGSDDKNDYQVDLSVIDSTVWYSCVNKGGNEAPGQLQFTGTDQYGFTPSEEPADANGRYTTQGLQVDEEDFFYDDQGNLKNELCPRNNNKDNWKIKTDADGPITFLQPHQILAQLFKLPDVTTALDEVTWTCTVPDPTYPLDQYDPGDLNQFCNDPFAGE